MSTARRRDTVPPTQLREGAFGNARALACRECGHEVALGPYYACPECFGPLEVAYDFPAGHPRGDRGRPAATSGATRRCCRCPTDIEQSPNTEPGFTRLLAARTTSAASSASSKLWVKDDSTNPTNSFKDRVVACALSAARELGAKVFACPSHRQPGQRRRRRRRPRRHQDRGLHPEQTSSSPSRSTPRSTPRTSSR